MLTKIEKHILNFIQEDLPLKTAPYEAIARRLNITEDEFVKKIANLKRRGYIRRFGAILNHRKVGLKVNCMCVWDVPKKVLPKIVKICRRQVMISHCYLRKNQRGWPYNFYTMIHGKTKSECIKLVKLIAKKNRVDKYAMLFTQKEFKKISPKYSV